MTIIHSVTFTPPHNCRLEVQCMYEAVYTAGTTSDWSSSGNSALSRCFVTQSGVTTYGNRRFMAATRTPQSVQMSLDVVGGVPVTYGLDGQLTGFLTAQWFNAQVQAKEAFK